MAHLQHTTKRRLAQLQFLHGLVILSWLGLAVLGQPVESQVGWISYSVRLPGLAAVSVQRKRRRLPHLRHGRLRLVWRYVSRSWYQPCVRSLFLAVLWALSGRQGPAGVLAWPWLLWVWQGWQWVGRR